jgi:tRNA-dihydrouridine synthase
MVEYKGEHIGVREMRKHGAWYIKGFNGASQTRVLLNSAKSKAEMEEIFQHYLVQLQA